MEKSAWSAERFKIFKLVYETMPELREKYINRMAVYLGDIFKTSACLDMVDEIVAEIEPEYLRHLQAFFDDVEDVNSPRYSAGWGWKGYLNYMRDTWIETRRENIYNHLKTRYDLGDIFDLKIDLNDGKISFNELPLSHSTFEGKWFGNKEISLKADKEDKWYVRATMPNGDDEVMYYYGDTLAFEPQEGYESYEISYGKELFSTVNNVKCETNDGEAIYYNIQGVRIVGTPTVPGLYVKVRGNNATKVIVK
jgi:hypothetical protein